MINFLHIVVIAVASFLFGFHPQQNIVKNTVSPTPTPSQSPITAIPTPKNSIVVPKSATDSQLHDCVVSGQVLQLTYSQCEHELSLQLVKDQQNAKYYEDELKNMPSAEQLMQQTANDIKNYYNNLPPTPTMIPLPTYQYGAPTPLSVTPIQSTTNTSNTSNTYLCGQIEANCAANGIDPSSGVCQSQMAQAGCL